LDQSLKDFLADISSDFPTLSEELGKILTNVLLDEGRSTLSQHLRRLKMYMTEAEFSRIKPVRVIEELSMAEIFAYLGYLPPELGAGVERHPMGRDLRKALRTNLDGLWSDQLACLGPSDIQLAACFPLNFMKLAEKLPVPLADFSFFYGLITNAKSPGRIWQPPLAFMGTKEAYVPYANLLEDSDFKTSRLGLSGTMPQTIKVFDTWLESKSLQDQLSKTTWRAYFQQKHELVNRHRISFLAALEKGRAWQA
ncbi:MAG: hypothetical protein KC422_25165, partial [Trueperaceae bacterium]|nr:hypothetical protein [Trueperaceae bacterium]